MLGILRAGKGWRTIGFNAAHAVPAAAIALIVGLQSDVSDLNTFLTAFLTPAKVLMITSGIGLVNVLLRLDTTGPVGTRE